MELPRTVSVAQAMLAPAWTSRSTFSLTSRLRSSPQTSPKVQIAQRLPAVRRTGHPVQPRLRQTADRHPDVSTFCRYVE